MLCRYALNKRLKPPLFLRLVKLRVPLLRFSSNYAPPHDIPIPLQILKAVDVFDLEFLQEGNLVPADEVVIDEELACALQVMQTL